MKKGLINAIILALVLINLILTIVMVFVFVPAINKTSNLVNKICTIVDLNAGDDSKEHEVDITKLSNVTVLFGSDTENTVSLAMDTDGKTHYIKVGLVISLDTTHPDYKEKAPAIESSMGLIASNTIDVVRSYKASEVDKTKMEQEVLKKLQNLFGSEFIYSVSFNQFTVQ
ncbi:MAG: flagellar basal body-associated FliL family protein [Butyrivibrio sp.]